MGAAVAEKLPAAAEPQVDGLRRSAILLMYLDRKVARSLLERLSTEEIRELGHAMAEIEDVPGEEVEQVIRDFVTDLHKSAMFPTTGRSFALGVLPDLLPEAQRGRLEGSLRRALSTEFQDYIATKSARAVAAILSDEHAQTRAVALVLMGTDNAAGVLRCMDEEERFDSAVRMAKLKNVPGELADDVERSLRQALEDDGSDRWSVQGVDRTAQVLGRLGTELNEPLLARLANENSALSDRLRRRMVVFQDLAGLDRRAVQALLKEIEKEDLLLALKGADAAMRDLFLRNLSSRAAADMEEELEIMGPVPKRSLQQAQENIVEVAMRLAEDGTIYLAVLESEDD